MSEFSPEHHEETPETPETPETIGLSEEIRGAIEAKFGFKIPPEATQINKEMLNLLTNLKPQGEEGMWFVDDEKGGKKRYMVINSTVNFGNRSLFNPPIREVSYSEEMDLIEPSLFR